MWTPHSWGWGPWWLPNLSWCRIAASCIIWCIQQKSIPCQWQKSRGRISITQFTKRDRPSFCTVHSASVPSFFFFFVSPSCFSSFARALFPTQFVAAETCEGLGTESGRPQRPEPSRGRGLPSGRPGREREREEGRAGEARACRRLRPHNSSQAIPLYTAQSYKLAGSCWPWPCVWSVVLLGCCLLVICICTWYIMRGNWHATTSQSHTTCGHAGQGILSFD